MIPIDAPQHPPAAAFEQPAVAPRGLSVRNYAVSKLLQMPRRRGGGGLPVRRGDRPRAPGDRGRGDVSFVAVELLEARRRLTQTKGI
jgi:hypothetical protein